MIRFKSEATVNARLVRQRKDLTERIAKAVEAMPYVVCDHNDRPSCPKCATRLTVRAAAAVVREKGGIS